MEMAFRRAAMTGRSKIFALCATSLLAPIPVPALADTLVDNVNGIRVDGAGRVERFSALLVDDAGKVRATFSERAKRPKQVQYRVDGQGRTLLPGFVDSHVNLVDYGLGAIGLDLASTTSLADALSRVADYARRNPNKPWIVGRGWNEAAWSAGRMPTAGDLDMAVGDRPVWLLRADGGAGWANTEALRRAGITAASKAPAGGTIVMAGGKPSGVLSGSAVALVESKLPPALPEERDAAVRKAQELFLARGVTAVADMGTSLLDWQSLRREGDYDRLQLRVVGYARGIDDMIVIAGPGPSPWLYGDRLKLAGVALTLDGTLAGRSAWLARPYADSATSGAAQIGGTPLRNLMSRAAMDDFQVAITANGDAAVSEALDAITEMKGSYAGDRRWRIEGAGVLAPTDIARAGQLGVVASMQPQMLGPERATIEARLGTDRLASVQAWKSLAVARATLAFGSGAPTLVPDALAGMADAISRQDAAGQPFAGWQPQEVLTREQALAAYTAGGAAGVAAEGRFGTLAVGEWADFVLVTVDPLLAPPATLRQGRVVETWIAGRKVWSSNGALPAPDVNAPATSRGGSDGGR